MKLIFTQDFNMDVKITKAASTELELSKSGFISSKIVKSPKSALEVIKAAQEIQEDKEVTFVYLRGRTTILRELETFYYHIEGIDVEWL